jgi:hypothetical protein
MLTKKICLYSSILILLLLGGCSEWSTEPTREKNDYGTSVKNMVDSQLYNAYAYHHPDPNIPEGMDGQKAGAIYQRTYQTDIGSAPRVRSLPQLNISSPAGGGSGGAGSSP